MDDIFEELKQPGFKLVTFVFDPAINNKHCLLDTIMNNLGKFHLIKTNPYRHASQLDCEVFDVIKVKNNNICDIIKQHYQDTSNSILLIDDLTRLMVYMKNEIKPILSLLTTLHHKGNHVICIGQRFNCYEEFLKNLEYLSTIYASVTTDYDHYVALIDNNVGVTHRTLAEKQLARITYKFTLARYSGKTLFKPFSRPRGNLESITDENSIEMLSFNLGLTDKEREAKDNVVLPFTRAQDPSISKIFYYPDKNDDVDEEDPDDDLNI